VRPRPVRSVRNMEVFWAGGSSLTLQIHHQFKKKQKKQNYNDRDPEVRVHLWCIELSIISEKNVNGTHTKSLNITIFHKFHVLLRGFDPRVPNLAHCPSDELSDKMCAH